MEAQVPTRRLKPDPIDDDTVLTLLELAGHATAGKRRRCEFVVVRDPDVRHQLARTYRQGWSIYKRVLHSRAGEDSLLAARQWEADHFEDVPVLDRRRAYAGAVRCSRRSARPRSTAARFLLSRIWPWRPRPAGWAPASRRLHCGRRGRPAAPSASLARSPRWPSWRSAGLAVRPNQLPVPPVGNLVHLDRFGHQPFRSRHPPAANADMA